MRKLYRHAVFVALVLSTAYQSAEIQISRRESIPGMEVPALHAHMVLPPNSPVMSRAAIYIEKTDRGYYFHSNFISRAPDGTFADNPTRILTTDVSNLLKIFETIVYWGQPLTPAREKDALTALNENVEIFLASNLFDQGGYPSINVYQAEHVSVVETSDLFQKTVPAEVLTRQSPPPILMAKIFGCCLYGIPPQLASSYSRALSAKPFPLGDVRLLSLTRDPATQKAIQQSPALSRAYIGDVNRPPADLAQIESAFASAQGKTVILVGTVEGENFVPHDTAGSVVSSIPVQAVRNLAAKHRVELIDVGCETDRRRKLEKSGVSFNTSFNTVDAMKALDRAISQSLDYTDFFESLTSERTKVVIDRGFTLGWPLCADIYAKPLDGPAWIKLARVFVSFRDKVGAVQNSN